MTTGPVSNPGSATHVILRPKDALPRLEAEYPIDRLPVTIGRHRSNDVELPFESVSRYHARIEDHDGQPRVLDLRSSNGTFVNGRRIQVAPLENGDLLVFGSIEFVVERRAGARRPASATGEDSRTIVRFEERSPTESVFEAEVPEDTSRIARWDQEITTNDQFRQAKERLVTFYRLQEILRSTTEEDRLLAKVLELLFQSLPVDRGAMLVRSDPSDTNSFQPVSVRVRQGGEVNPAEAIGISKTILMKCLREKVAVLTTDAPHDRRFSASDSIVLNRVHAAICAPMTSHHHFFGFIYLDTSSSIRSFGKDDLAFVASVAGEVAVHLLNIRMLQEKIRNERMAAIGQTITGMAHNIKNVLLLSQGGMELMARNLREKRYDALEDTWGLARRGMDRINQMVKDMLDYTRARVVEKTRCQVNELLSEIRETFGEEMGRRGVTCESDLDPHCPPVMIDADGLDKAVMNLLTNAVEACPMGSGVIWLRTRVAPDRTLRIQVEDNAGGIPAEVLPRIFTPFFTTKGAKGTGLGLAMTKKFIEDMGGRIDVRTEEGKGTTFEITLPLESGEVRLEEEARGE